MVETSVSAICGQPDFGRREKVGRGVLVRGRAALRTLTARVVWVVKNCVERVLRAKSLSLGACSGEKPRVRSLGIN